MDSPLLQSATLPSSGSRVRSHNSFSHNSPVDARTGAIQKQRSSDRTRSISTTQADRLYRLATEQAEVQQQDSTIQPASLGVQWITPQHSPQLSGFSAQPAIEPFPQWTAPTPPRSDSGIPNVSIDSSSEEPVTTGISGGEEFAFEQSSNSAEMSSLGFLLPSQYGASPYDTEPSNYAMDQNFPPMRMSQPPSTSGASAYAQTTSSSSPSLYQSRAAEEPSSRRASDMPPTSSSSSPYAQDYRRTSHPYGGGYSVPPSQTIPSISGLTQSPLPSPHMSSSSAGAPPAQYNSSMSRSHTLYDPQMYQQSGPYSSAPPTQQMYSSSQSPTYQQPPFVGSSVNEVLAKPMGSDSSIRVLNQRPKPQCWEHGCNGRQFSTFSNLLRHQREKSGTAAKSYCPKCGAEFTRTTARNGHLAHDKCTKQRRQSDGK